MAKLIILIVSTILCAQLATANTAKDGNVFSDILNSVETKLTEVHGRFLSFLNVDDNSGAADKIVSESKQYATKLSALVDEIKEKAKSSTGELSEATTALTAKLTEIVGKLETDTPELKKYRETLESSLNTVVEETKKFSAQAGPINDEMNNVLQKVLTSTRDVASSVTSTVEDAIKKP